MTLDGIGLGDLGAPLCRNLIRRGHDLIVHEFNTAAQAQMASLGAMGRDNGQ